MNRILHVASNRPFQYLLKNSVYHPCRFYTQTPSIASTVLTNELESQIPPLPNAIKLRGYQEECIQSVLTYLKEGHKRLGISLATGSGKTVIFTQLIDRVAPPKPKTTRTLILAHRRELVEQAARHCQNAYPTKSVEVEMGKTHASGMADITVASVQSIRSGDRLAKFDPSRFKLVLVDEAHHIVASQYLEVLDHFKLKDAPVSEDGTALVGVSATFSRFDGRQLGQIIDQIVFHKDYIDMIGEKWLSDVIFTTVETRADIRKIGTGATGDFQTGALSRAVNTDEINEATVRAWIAKATNRKSTIVFCVDLDHVTKLTAMFRRYGYEAQFVTGDTAKKVRGDRLDSFRNGEFPVLLNCGVFTEGTDIPNIDCVLLTRPTKSRNLLVQMIGRGMRLHPSKENCHIIDMVSSLSTGVVSTPTLFGLDPAAIVENANVNDMKDIRERKEKEQERELQAAAQAATARRSSQNHFNSTLSFTDYDSVTDLLEDTVEERQIRRLSPNAWVCVAEAKFILSTNKGDYLTIELSSEPPTPSAPSPSEPSFTVKHTRKLPPGTKSPYARPASIVRSAPSLAHAVHAADTFAAACFEHFAIAKHLSWRRAPASESQLKFLNKLRPAEDQLTSGDVSKGRAGDMITKIKHGARGRFGRIERARRGVEREERREKVEGERKGRESVKVGPLVVEGVEKESVPLKKVVQVAKPKTRPEPVVLGTAIQGTSLESTLGKKPG